MKPIQTDISIINKKMDTLLYNCITLSKSDGSVAVGNGTPLAGTSSLTLNADIQILTDLLTRINHILSSELLNIKK